MRHLVRSAAALFTTALLLLVLAAPAAPPARAADDPAPTVELSDQEAGAGDAVTVMGKGWQPGTLLTLLVCGQNAIGGTNACANSAGRAVTTDGGGAFRREMPVAEPPKPCPCVIHVSTVTGEPVVVDAPFTVAGHPVAALPERSYTGRLARLTVRLDGDSGFLTWFGAPPRRELVVTVGNLGSEAAKDPLFDIGVSHGVFAPQWEEQRWKGTVRPGHKARITLPVELAEGAHGEYRVALKYDGTVLATRTWDVPRPWGVTLFWILLCVVVPTAVFRIGMAVVDTLRPRPATPVPAPGPPAFTQDTLPIPWPVPAPSPKEST